MGLHYMLALAVLAQLALVASITLLHGADPPAPPAPIAAAAPAGPLELVTKARHREWEVVSMVRLLSPSVGPFLSDPLIGFGSDEPGPCKWLAAHREQEGQHRAAQGMARGDIVEGLRSQCEFSLKLRSAVLPTLFRLAYSAQPPNKLYGFGLSLGTQYLSQTAGVFTDEKSCRQLLDEARRLNYAVGPCVILKSR